MIARPALLVALLFGGDAVAQEAADPPASPEPASKADIDELRRAILVRDQVIRNLIERIEELEAGLADPGETQPLAEVEESPPPAESDPADAQQTAEAALPEQEDATGRQRLIRQAFERTLIDRGGLLLRPWTLEAEPSVSYISSSSDNILIDGFSIFPVLVVGDIFSEEIQRDIVQGAGTFRLGLPWDFQFETRVPFAYLSQRTFSADNVETDEDAFNLGDLEIAVSKQLLRSKGGAWPDLLGSIRWSSTTGDNPFDAAAAADESDVLTFGSGFHSISGSLTAVKVYDPVVFFGGATYTGNLPADQLVGRFNAGDTVGFQFGMALALNLDTSISINYGQQFTFRSTLDGVPVPGSGLTTGTLGIGGSFAFRRGPSIDLNVGIGLTEDAPDVQVTLAVPFRFFDGR